jgi:hypothetical protein
MLLIITGMIAILLYLLVQMRQRIFGVLGLGLVAGTVLVESVGIYVSNYLSMLKVLVAPLDYKSVSSIVLILLPALIMLIAGPSSTNKKRSRLGALLFAIFSTALILVALAGSLVTSDEPTRQILSFISKNQSYILPTIIILSVIDIILYRPPKIEK